MDDKAADRDRYDHRAAERLSQHGASALARGAQSMPPVIRAPYLAYEAQIARLLGPNQDVMELGAGSGLHTGALLRTGARVTATDIAPNALAVLERDLAPTADGRLRTQVADMERLPFDGGTFDVVAAAGCLSYGDPTLVDAEVRRVLKPGGHFIAVDSLNHNPIYRFNRWLRYVRGDRTRATLMRMPTLARLNAFREQYRNVDVRFFGAATWALGPAAMVLGDATAARLSDTIDRLVRVRASAFKFVLAAQQRL